MKLRMTVIMILSFALLLCACGSVRNDQQSVGTPIATTEATAPETTEPSIPETTEPSIPETTAAPTSGNEFFNGENVVYEPNNVTIRPRHVYWNGDCLIAECFVINGMSKPVYNLDLEKLVFSNANGVIADGYFGKMQNSAVGPNSYIRWTFEFEPDTIIQPGADLSSLRCQFRVGYSY